MKLLIMPSSPGPCCFPHRPKYFSLMNLSGYFEVLVLDFILMLLDFILMLLELTFEQI